ncbi:hypothetical protein AA313_de0208428 [Arthrobotrys entomopaga]|nr:hypothetical protein AA313_de0208428 [Arthrobotrys entomopaga]
MGWWWNSSNPPDGKKSKPSDSKATLSTLDSSLQDYLKTSTPKDKPTAPAPEPDPLLFKPSSKLHKQGSFESVPRDYAEPAAPHAQSAYGDRYAEYWASYKGPDGSKVDSPEIVMREFVDGFKQIRQNIAAAASENCAMEEIELHECYKHGTWYQRIRMCTEESQKLSKCLTQQKEFLRTLGYLGNETRDPKIDERIQMHADKLYRLQLEQDEATKKAVKEGKDIDEAVAKVKAAQEKAGAYVSNSS